MQFTTVSDNNFSGGINQNAIETMIPEGYIEMGYNADTNSSGSLTKRRGYQSFAGMVPVRPTSIAGDGTHVTIGLPAGCNLLNYSSVPIYLSGTYGTTSIAKYYTGFRTNVRKPLIAGTGTISLTNTHGFAQPYMDVGCAESLSSATSRNQLFTPDSITINKANNYVNVGYSTPANTSAFIFFKEHATTGPSSTITKLFELGSKAAGTYVLPLAHALNSQSLGYAVFTNDAGVLSKVIPNELTLDDLNTATISITLASTTVVEVLLWVIPEAQQAEHVVDSLGVDVLCVIADPASADITFTPYMFPYVYWKEVVGGGFVYHAVQPDDITYDAVANTHTVTYQGTTTDVSGNNLVVIWECVDITSTSTLELDDATSITLTSDISLSLYGLDHKLVWGNTPAERAGWVNHIDSYLTVDAQHVVCGLGGALFRNEDPGIDPLHVGMFARASTSHIIGPAFGDASYAGRTRPYIRFSGGNIGGKVKSITWISGNELQALVYMPAYTLMGGGTLADALTADFDHITLESTGYHVNSGTFPIVSVAAVDTDHITINYTNPERGQRGTIPDNGDWNELDCGAKLYCATDKIALDNARFLYGDLITASNITAANGLNVIDATDSTHIVVAGCVDRIAIAAGQRIAGTRTSQIVPLRTLENAHTTEGYVNGDVISLGTIIEVNTAADQLFTYDVVEDVYTCTATSVWNTGYHLQTYNRDTAEIIVITNILTATTFTATGGTLDGVSKPATILGKTITLDVATSFTDDTSNLSPLTIPYRWINIESTVNAATAFDANTPTTQRTIRSTMANESMFLTSADDAILKYDGDKQYRSGLPRWNPLISYSIDTTATDTIELAGYSASVTSYSGNVFTMGTVAPWVLGDTVKYGTEIYTVTNLDTTLNKVTVNKSITGTATGTLYLAGVFKYYFRLNSVDRSGSMTSGTACALGDAVVSLGASAAVNFRFATLPTGIGNFPTNNISLQVYRTLQGKAAPYYLITSLPITNTADIVFTDTLDDSVVGALDPINSALLGQEVGTTWDIAPRAEALTVINNRLVLANVFSLPELTLTLIHKTQLVEFTQLVDMSLVVNGTTFAATATKTAATPSSVTVGSTNYVKLTTAATVPQIGQWLYFTNGDARISGWGKVIALGTGPATITLDIPWVTGAKTTSGWVSAATYPGIPVPLYNELSCFQRAGTDLITGTEVMRRFAAAINAFSARTSSYLTADAGAEYDPNTINIKLPRSDTALEVTLTAPSCDANLYVDNAYVLKGVKTTSVGNTYRSRLMLSQPKFPEIFDAVDNVIDINPDDGETITAVVPFFGRSAFGAAQTDGPLLVLKTNSIYVVDMATRAVKKLDTQNIGCTYPYSIANTKNGVMFANYSGIYSLDQNLRLEYMGEAVRRSWRELVDRSRIYTLTAHHHGNSNRYKLSAPLLTSNAQNYWTFVYDHTCENSSQVAMTGKITRGAWMINAPMPAVGWCNFGTDELMARSDGRVYIQRQTNTNTDYRDGADPIEFNVTLRANMFGNGGVRKTIRRIIAHFRSIGASTIQVSQSLNTSNTFGVLDGIKTWTPLDTITMLDPISVVPPGYTTALSDNSGLRVMDVIISPKNARCLFYRLNFRNNELDQGVELAGVDYRVAGMTHTGMVSSAGSSGGGTNAGT